MPLEPLQVPFGYFLKPQYRNGFVGHWKMNVGGVLIPDLSGYNNHGTRTNMANPPTAISGWAGLGDILDGVNDYVDGSITQITNSQYTVSGWVKIDQNFPASQVRAMFDFNGYPYFIPHYYNSNQMLLYLSSGNYKYANLNLNDNKWHYIVFIVMGSGHSDIDNSKIYVDGVSVGNVLGFHSSGSSPTLPTTNFRIGGDRYMGQIDDVRIYNRALTADEVAHACFQQEDEWDLGLDDDLAIMQGIPIELMRGGVA